ncbi:hypothetical protein FNH09_09140 [Streptomyces adustus]|uniref:Uncharacterized protein n=1 Tax=Streptomyces adustus TaxID=1609272 RepID=A0A5N8VBN4_9ACTN|nr:hypothetical protein [Streptomyces adustus]
MTPGRVRPAQAPAPLRLAVVEAALARHVVPYSWGGGNAGGPSYVIRPGGPGKPGGSVARRPARRRRAHTARRRARAAAGGRHFTRSISK